MQKPEDVLEPIITPEMLAATGIDIPDEQISPMLDYFNEILEERVGEAVVNSFDENRFNKFTAMQEDATKQEISDWMQANVLNLDMIIQDEVETLLGEAVEYSKEFSASLN